MNFLFVTELYAPSVGGLEARIAALAQELVAQGHRAEVWCIDHQGRLPQHERIGGVTVERLASRSGYAGGRMRRHWPTVIRFCWRLWRAAARMRQFDAIVFGKWPLLPALIIPIPGDPVVAFDWCELRSGPLWHWLYRRVLKRQGWKHVAIHQGVREFLESQGVPRSRVSVIGSAAPPVVAEPPRSDRSILFLGRLSEHKQPLKLLRAFASVDLGRKGYRLHFAGGGPLAQSLVEQAGSVAGVTIHGRVSEEEKRRLLASCSLLALTSLREGFPVVIAEACAFGTPCLTIAAPDNGAAWVINDLGCGWVVDDTVEDIAAGLARHAERSAEWELRSANGVARSRDRLDIGTQARTLQHFLGQDLGSPNHPEPAVEVLPHQPERHQPQP